ncbi:MAG: hypothetical protein JXA53_10385 [Bacteroidales bacterium]|nr:hypothetical protein [Bacteroidales bacterium]
MKRKGYIFIATGMLSLAIVYVPNGLFNCNLPDFILGFFTGLSIAFNLVGVYFISKNKRGCTKTINNN